MLFSTTSNRNSNFKDKIMVKYTNKDYENMIQCYKACDHNSVKASAMYRKLYPNCGSPSPRTILLAMNRQRTTGNVTVVREYVETPSKVREQRIEKVLAAYESSDNISGNEIAKQVGVPKSTTHTILKKKKDSKKLRENEGDGCLIDLQREGSSHHNSRIQRNADSETVDLDDPTWMPET
ncbi:uncharacterized protein [Chelonus insularis]|uniref:uncharacterized protein isoform X2 n=1 Tax=Chelonus insularis TaxID=460826 RepID=UPI00158E19DF|nr:uncharacterized protein LOC118073057 isoform X2 [Chelonus insularis]